MTTYHVERSTTSSSGFAEIGSVLSATTTFSNNTGLTAATQYFYRVRACNAGGCSAYTLEASATTQPNPPGAPSGLTATAVSSGQINLSWSAAIGTVATYHVERSTTSGSGFAEIGSVGAATTTFPNSGLSAATQYFYRVRACNTGGCSAYTLEASATTQPNPPGAPSGLTATAVSSGQINLSWSAGSGIVDSYRIERKTGAAAFAEIAVVPAATLTHSDLGLTAATQYDYQVRACNSGGCSAFSAPASATTLPGAPGAPSGLTAGAVSATQIDLSWIAGTGTVATYHVERSTTSGAGFTEIASVSGATTTFPNTTGLAAATQYFYRVRACNTGGCSAYTAEAAATTLPNAPGAPSGLGATAISLSQIDLSWTAATGTVATYHVERSITSGSGFAEIGSVSGATTALQNTTGLLPATLYFYRVRACNTGGCSAYTAEASATTLPAAPPAQASLSAAALHTERARASRLRQ